MNIKFDVKSGIGRIQGDISDGAIKRTFDRLPFFFPHETKYQNIYQSIAESNTSGMYWGNPDINSIASHITRYALYTPRIIVANPFCDRMLYHLDHSPTEHPGEWKQLVANRAMFLVSIEPWIRENIITVLPTLKWADWDFFDKQIVPISKKRYESLTSEQHDHLTNRSMFELASSLAPEDIPWFLSQNGIGPNSSFAKELADYMSQELEFNPARYAWSKGEGNQLVNIGSGNTMEASIYQAKMCKSYLLLGDSGYRSEYEFAVNQTEPDIITPNDALTATSKAFSSLDFSFLNGVSLDFVLSLRKDNRLGSLREFLHDTFKKASSIQGIENLNSDSLFHEKLESEYQNYKQEWKSIQNRLAKDAAVAAGAAAVSVLSGHIGMTVALGGFAAFGLNKLIDKQSERNQHEALPLGVFFDLEKGSK